MATNPRRRTTSRPVPPAWAEVQELCRVLHDHLPGPGQRGDWSTETSLAVGCVRGVLQVLSEADSVSPGIRLQSAIMVLKRLQAEAEQAGEEAARMAGPPDPDQQQQEGS